MLRAANVGGRNRVAMPRLREVVAGTGAEDVETYIQSGNVVFTSSERSTANLEKAIAAGIQAEFGLDLDVIVRSRSQLAAVVKANPFLKRGEDPKLLHVAFLAKAPAKSGSRFSKLARDAFAPDEFALKGREVYLFCPNGFGRSKVTQAVDATGVPATVRNWNTVEKLLGMADG